MLKILSETCELMSFTLRSIACHDDELKNGREWSDKIEAYHNAQDTDHSAPDFASHGWCTKLVEHCERIKAELESALWLRKERFHIWISSCCTDLVAVCKCSWDNSDVDPQVNRLLLFSVINVVSL